MPIPSVLAPTARAVTPNDGSASAGERLNESWRRLLKTAAMLLCEFMMRLLPLPEPWVCAVSNIGGIPGRLSSRRFP